MAQQKRNGRGNGSNPRRTPTQSTQPWLGWVAAGLVVLIVVVAVAMGLERSNQRDSLEAEVNMTPIVGGMAVATAAGSGQDAASNAGAASGEPDVTSLVTVTMPLTETEGVTEAAALTDTSDVTDTSGATETEGLTGTEPLTDSAAVTDADGLTDTGAVTTTDVTMTEEATGADETLTETDALTQSAEAATPEPEPTPTRTPRPTPSPTPTRSGPPPSFAVGDSVVNEQGQVTLHADTTLDSLVLDTINPGVAMTVIEPSGSDESYPVENEGYGWVRVRSVDGLVGWAITDGLSRVP